MYDVNGDVKRLDPQPKWVRGGNELKETAGIKTSNSVWQVDKFSSSGSSKLISEERSAVPDRST
jgi:hypothetical protein